MVVGYGLAVAALIHGAKCKPFAAHSFAFWPLAVVCQAVSIADDTWLFMAYQLPHTEKRQ